MLLVAVSAVLSMGIVPNIGGREIRGVTRESR